ncbi:MAG: transposase [Solirubrobacteraceae bacterium MAG38_C4-C5]|nr:transposase [Candidatus Siliceabacter maunaloa]
MAAAIEVRGGGSGRLRLAAVADASGPTLQTFATRPLRRGPPVHTDGLAQL